MCFFLPALGAAGAAAAGGAASAGIGTAMSIVGTLASTALGVMQAQASSAAAQAQYQQQVQFRKEQEVQAQKTLNMQVAQQSANLESQKDSATRDKRHIASAALEAASRASATAAGNGIVGVSLGHVLADIEGKKADGQGAIDYNVKVAQYNSQNELAMAQRGLGARLAEIPHPVKPKFGGIQVASALVGGLTNLAKLQIGKTDQYTPGYQDPNGGYIGNFVG